MFFSLLSSNAIRYKCLTDGRIISDDRLVSMNINESLFTVPKTIKIAIQCICLHFQLN